MSIVVAGFNRNQGSLTGPAYSVSSNNEKPSDSTWRSQCRIHSQGQTNPYIRAIFSYIASGDWRDVLDEKSLCLADRVGVALRFLGDDEVTLKENASVCLVCVYRSLVMPSDNELALWK